MIGSNTIVVGDNMNIMSLEEIKKYLPNGELGEEHLNLIQSVPKRFRDDAYYALEYCEDFKTTRKAWEYFLDDIYQELTLEERVEYNFTTEIVINIEKTALKIAIELMQKYRDRQVVDYNEFKKQCKEKTILIKEDIENAVIEFLDEQGYKLD